MALRRLKSALEVLFDVLTMTFFLCWVIGLGVVKILELQYLIWIMRFVLFALVGMLMLKFSSKYALLLQFKTRWNPWLCKSIAVVFVVGLTVMLFVALLTFVPSVIPWRV